MSLRPPSAGASAAEAAFDTLDHEILAEKAAALGRAGQRVEETLTKLRQNNDEISSNPVRTLIRFIFKHYPCPFTHSPFDCSS